VKTEEELARAFGSAKKIGRYVSVEKHLSGSVCRATVVGNKLAGFFEAHPPRVIGDGISTISELVEKRNARKPGRVSNIVVTDEHRHFLRRQGISPDSVLEKGRTIDLSHRTGRLFGGETRELLDTVHPKLRDYAERAAKTLNVPLVGFDLIIKNPESDPDAQEWGIIEANSLAFIDLHYLPLHGKPSNPAAAVWRLWKETV
jgi:D-alanine-D-alanine ligase-like ATP-grasp enzyme